MSKVTLRTFKKEVYSLIEEVNPNSEYLTDDIDLRAKFNEVTNTIMYELFSLRKHVITDDLEVHKGEEIVLPEEYKDFYLLEKITGVDYTIINDIVTFNEDGTARIYYYKFPKRIDENTPNEYTFDLDNNVIEAMKYGVASDILKSDISSQYGAVYSARYQELKNMLDTRFARGSITIVGGI